MRDTVEDVIILAGGLGTRLRSVLSDRPKAMAPVRGRPLLEWLLLALTAQGHRRVILATGHKADAIQAHFPPGLHFGIEVVHSREDEPLGTGGALRQAASLARTTNLLVLNGDTICRFDVARLRAVHLRQRAAVTIWLAWSRSQTRFGFVDIDGRGRVLDFREKSGMPATGLVNTGVYMFERAATQSIGHVASLETDVFPSLIGHGLYGVVGMHSFVDIGTPESLADAGRLLATQLDELERLQAS
jgi:D-glycero-alpha-D-manno-heptose 1-phosphate guanylyltransferase